MATPVKMPQLGESVHEGTIGKWLKQPGDRVEKYEPLLEVISDKVDTEVTATESGVLLSIEVPEGQTVPVGTVLAWIGEPGEQPGREDGDEPAQAAAQPAETTPAQERRERGARPKKPMRVSPVVARLAAEHDVDLSQVRGTGRGGRITKKDILAYIEARKKAAEAKPEPTPTPATPAPAPEPAQPAAPPPAPAVVLPGEGELVPLTPMRKAIAEHMVRSKHTAPHVTSVFEADLSRIVAHRRRHKADYEREGLRLTFTAYFVEAVAQTLRKHPTVNSTFTDDGILVRKAINIGVAVATEGGQGLIVPVIRNADELNLKGIVRALNDITDRARGGRLVPDDVQGGTFTITNHGVGGSLFGTPIINQPQSAIMGIGKIQKRAVVIEHDGVDAIAIRPMVYVTITFDHRVLDGASADAFMVDVIAYIENYPL